MKIYLFLLSSFLLFIALSSCKKEMQGEVLPYTLTENNGIVGKWLCTESFDTYDRYWQEANLKYTTQLEFSKNGEYLEKGFQDNMIYCEGEYEVTDIDSVWINSSCYTSGYKQAIDELTPTTLITVQGGIHGPVYIKYKAIK
ncbi:hypothetical protein [Bernardetia sp.]|uniref:hypothetical protein n=1 Tax=Bernardetia sp. TaxID=1937974 RepID=UPI0025C18A5D|nr:hypothetical protein [Bernardetia sp.]